MIKANKSHLAVDFFVFSAAKYLTERLSKVIKISYKFTKIHLPSRGDHKPGNITTNT